MGVRVSPAATPSPGRAGPKPFTRGSVIPVKRFLWGAVGVALAAGTSACSDDCTRNEDCALGQVCIRNTCRPDPDPDDPLPTGRDRRLPAPGDGGSDGGAGEADGGRDGGDGGNGGPPEVRGFGRVVLFQFFTSSGGGSEGRVEAVLVDEGSATVTRTEETLPDIQAGTCVLRTRQVDPAGMTAPFLVDSVVARLPAGPVLRLEPDSTTGELELEAPDSLPDPLFPPGPVGDPVTFELAAGTTPLQDLEAVSVNVPASFTPLTPMVQNQPVQLAAGSGIQFTWQSQAGPIQNFALELYDPERDVVLRCTASINLGSYTLPPAAVEAFLDENPSGTLTLDVGFEGRTVEEVEVMGGGDPVEIEFRVLRGARYPVQR
jgi:hypothetical protein